MKTGVRGAAIRVLRVIEYAVLLVGAAAILWAFIFLGFLLLPDRGISCLWKR